MSLFFFPLSALIFVVDSTDSDRLEEAYDELAGLVTEKQLKDAMLLVFANKQVCKEHNAWGCIDCLSYC